MVRTVPNCFPKFIKANSSGIAKPIQSHSIESCYDAHVPVRQQAITRFSAFAGSPDSANRGLFWSLGKIFTKLFCATHYIIRCYQEKSPAENIEAGDKWPPRTSSDIVCAFGPESPIRSTADRNPSNLGIPTRYPKPGCRFFLVLVVHREKCYLQIAFHGRKAEQETDSRRHYRRGQGTRRVAKNRPSQEK